MRYFSYGQKFILIQVNMRGQDAAFKFDLGKVLGQCRLKKKITFRIFVFCTTIIINEFLCLKTNNAEWAGETSWQVFFGKTPFYSEEIWPAAEYKLNKEMQESHNSISIRVFHYVSKHKTSTNFNGFEVLFSKINKTAQWSLICNCCFIPNIKRLNISSNLLLTLKCHWLNSLNSFEEFLWNESLFFPSSIIVSRRTILRTKFLGRSYCRTF
jgi:hypothetical protein